MPLTGLRILDLTRLLPGGFCTMMLADLGADVLKVEEPRRGDYIREYLPKDEHGESAYHLAYNRNKRSLGLNLKSPKGVEVFKKLASRADVLVEGFRPGVMDRLGVGYSQLSPLNPRLIYCSLSGYGQEGPYKHKVGHDINYIGYAGVLGITGIADGPPVIPGVQTADIGGGGLMAAFAILAALLSRERTGEGQYLDVSMLDGTIAWLSLHAAAYLLAGERARRGRAALNGGYPCYNIYPTKDGKYVTLGNLEEQFWKELCRVINRPDLLHDAYATGKRGEEVRGELERVFQEKTREEWLEVFSSVDVCFGPAYELEEVFEDPQVKAREMVTQVPHPKGGSSPGLGVPVKFSKTPGRMRLPAPSLGQHTEEVLKGLGYGDEEVGMLRQEGAI